MKHRSCKPAGTSNNILHQGVGKLYKRQLTYADVLAKRLCSNQSMYVSYAQDTSYCSIRLPKKKQPNVTRMPQLQIQLSLPASYGQCVRKDMPSVSFSPTLQIQHRYQPKAGSAWFCMPSTETVSLRHNQYAH